MNKSLKMTWIIRDFPSSTGTLVRGIRMLLLLAIFLVPAYAGSFELGPPPQFPQDLSTLSLPGTGEIRRSLTTTGGFTVNPQNRAESQAFYNTYYLASENTPNNWTGNLSVCNEGTTAQTFQDAVLLRANWFRAMAGVPANVTFSSTYSSKSQKAALMMSANNSLSHYPPSSWTCYTAEGAEAAQNSNLSLGDAGWDAITGYVQDFGVNNAIVGHRRWLLYPQTQIMGTGDIPDISGSSPANALWVFDSNVFGPRPSTREEYVAWPPPGYVPYQVVFARWSFSYPDADFSSTSVSMSSNGSALPVQISTPATGYGENTLVWIPNGLSDSAAWPRPSTDTTYAVTLTNVLIQGVPRSFTYYVTVYDPIGPNADVAITGLTTDLAGCPAPMAPMTFTAHAAGAEYKFWYRYGYGTPYYDTNPWQVIQDFDPNNQLNFWFSGADNVIVVIWAVADPSNIPAAVPIIGMNVKVGGDASAVQFTGLDTNLTTNTKAGDPVTFVASATGPPPIYYKFWYRSGYGTSAYDTNPWLTMRDFGVANTTTMQFPAADHYIVVVWGVTDPFNIPADVSLIGMNAKIKSR